MVDHCSDAAGEIECDVDTTVERLFRAFRLSRTEPVVRAAAIALEDLGIEPVYRPTGGGSDANALIANGLPVLNVANATERNHQPDESVTVEALERMLDVVVRIVERSAEV
jgi:tripeptide aminopeptidase